MKKLRVLSVLAVFVLIATSAMPVMAKGKGPELKVTRVETSEQVRDLTVEKYMSQYPESANLVAASACKGYTVTRTGYGGPPLNLVIWRYSWTIDWCYDGTKITSLSKYRTVYANIPWSFRGEVPGSETQSGGVGQASYMHYAQGDFCMLDVGGAVCITHSYPWVKQTVRGDGTYTGSAGGL